MQAGVLLAFLAYAIFSMADALIKGIGQAMSVFEIAFFTTAFSIMPLVIINRGERWRDMFRMKHPYLVQLRCITSLVSTACVMFAFTHLPFAEVYAIAFATPVFVTVLSVFALREHVSVLRWVLLLIGFMGVVLVIRPGVRPLELAHVVAFAIPFLGAVTTVVLRHVAPHEKRVSLVGLAVLYSMAVNGVLMLPSFVLPSWEQLAIFALIGTFGGIGGLLVIAATRRIPANLVAPVQYSQLIWAIILGAVFWGEFPDTVAVIGLFIVLIAGLLNVLTEKTRIRWKPRVFFFRSGL